MKKSRSKFYRNPAPFSLAIVNPAKKKKKRLGKRRGKRRNPAVSGTVARKVGKRGWHHARGRFLYNPAKKTRRRKKARRNPLEFRHVLVDSSAKNPTAKKSAMSKRKHRKRSRNPVVRRSGGRVRHRRRRNPSRRFRRLRNPIAILQDVTSRENLTQGAGALAGVVGSNWLLNTLIQGDATTGGRMFDLPGVTYSSVTAPLTPAQFREKNKIALGFYKVAIPIFVGYFMRNQSAAFSRGLYNSAVINAGIALLSGTEIGARAGVGAFLPRQRGMNTSIPGVPPMLSGPATAYLNNGSPIPGMGAAVNPGWSSKTVNSVADPFAR